MKKHNLKKIILNLLLCSCIVLCSCTNNSEPSLETSSDTSTNDSSITEDTLSAETSSTEEINSEEENLVNIRYDMINIEETLLVDNEDFSYKITGIDPYYDDGKAYALTAEEIIKTDNPQTKIFFDYIIVNGVQCNFGQTEDSVSSARWITLNYLELSKIGITDITDITIVYNISEKYDEDSWTGMPNEDPIYIYPYGENHAERYVHQDSADETIILDNEYAKIYVSDVLNSTSNIFIENKTNDILYIDIYAQKINGYDTENYLHSSIFSNTYKYESFIPFSLNTIVDNSITQINNVELEIIINNNYTSTDTITLDTNITLNTIEHPISENTTIEITNFENIDDLCEYVWSQNQSVGADFNFSESTNQTILYNGAHYEISDDSLPLITLPNVVSIAVDTDEYIQINNMSKEGVYFLWFETTSSELELPIYILYKDCTIEKITLYLTIKQ